MDCKYPMDRLYAVEEFLTYPEDPLGNPPPQDLHLIEMFSG